MQPQCSVCGEHSEGVTIESPVKIMGIHEEKKKKKKQGLTRIPI